MKRTLVIYESKYDYMEEMAKNTAMILGPSKYCRVQEFEEKYKEFDCFVIGCSMHDERSDEKIYKFVNNNKEWLTTKSVALFCTCINEKNGEKFLASLNKILGKCVLYSKALPNKLSIKDTVKFGLEVKHKRDHVKTVPHEEMRKYVEGFIKQHNTCDLATSGNKNIRSTPIEYTLKNHDLYFISEGGEKFANILVNPNVSISIYDNYDNMSKLAGMQILGNAVIIPNDSDEYNDFMKFRGLDVNKLPIFMNLIKVEIKGIEFLWSGFKNMGYDAKQYYSVV